MSFSWRDLHRLQKHLVGALAALTIAALLAGWSVLAANSAEQAYLAATNKLARSEQHLRQSQIDQSDAKENWQTFQSWKKAGLLDAEQRLTWGELLSTIQHDLRLPGMDYEFASQTPLEAGKNAAYAHFSSNMRLQLRLLHEGDLLNFLARLQAEASALVLVQSCQLSPIASTMENALPQLSADCALRWITLGPTSPLP